MNKEEAYICLPVFYISYTNQFQFLSLAKEIISNFLNASTS